MNKPRICAVIVNGDLAAVKKVEPHVDLFEVRIDLIGAGWKELAGRLKKPWIACNRNAEEGGNWKGSEEKRIEELLSAIDLGAKIIDIELSTGNLKETVKLIKKRAGCILSFHDFKETPSLDSMREITQRQIDAGADICKVVTTAQKFEDNNAVLRLISEFPETRIVSFAMGTQGLISRILCPLAGGDFTYASIETGKESAPGQVNAADLRKIYGTLQDGE